ncbi:DnaJ like chaperone protein [Lutibacter sp. Hel_I_33_5]|uniref:TerB family tellurite resistance protein n=1 Tax=Lutibacter sp. Hel_I_33_5 TaxID=1566289 RepID=UPI0011A59D21|nr:TerB family tellurite resistance protein [Lutibacter sp. Hel_I_33_5]TVZ56570.1 DnaJ like chaperone protein [Lutibacter sp. Hel_I_33_5]
MASFAKWLGASLGFSFGGPIGGIIGFAVGSFVDGFSGDDFSKEQEKYARQSRVGGKAEIQSGDFEISLLVLAAIVIKADGKIDKRELEYVRQQFIGMYGKQRAENAFKLFKGIIKKQISARQVCMQIRQHMPHASRLQLIHFLFGIAKADNFVETSEVDEIKKIAGYLYINQRDFDSIKAMFFNEINNAYTILEIDKNATVAEIKKAYRKMVKKYHPDKLQGMGKEHINGAEAKFQKVQEAYDQLKKEKNF